jgi:hypothetical protein
MMFLHGGGVQISKFRRLLLIFLLIASLGMTLMPDSALATLGHPNRHRINIKQHFRKQQEKQACQQLLKGTLEQEVTKIIEQAVGIAPETAVLFIDFFWQTTVIDILLAINRPEMLVLPEMYPWLFNYVNEAIGSNIQYGSPPARMKLLEVINSLKNRWTKRRQDIRTALLKALETALPANLEFAKTTDGQLRKKIEKIRAAGPEEWAEHTLVTMYNEGRHAGRMLWEAPFIPIPHEITPALRETAPVFRIDFLSDRVARDLMNGGPAAAFWRTELQLSAQWYLQGGHGPVFRLALREMLGNIIRQRFTYQLWQNYCDYEMGSYPEQYPPDLPYDSLILCLRTPSDYHRAQRSPLPLNRWDDTSRSPGERQAVASTLENFNNRLATLRQLEKILLLVVQQNLNWEMLRGHLHAQGIKLHLVLKEEDPRDALEMTYLLMEEMDTALLTIRPTRREIESYEKIFDDAETADNLLRPIAENISGWRKPPAVSGQALNEIPQTLPSSVTTVAAPSAPFYPGFLIHTKFAGKFNKDPNRGLRHRLIARLWRFRQFGQTGTDAKPLNLNTKMVVYELKMSAWRIYYLLEQGQVMILYYGRRDHQTLDLENIVRNLADGLWGVPWDSDVIANLSDQGIPRLIDQFLTP